jgi:hypothetical protein
MRQRLLNAAALIAVVLAWGMAMQYSSPASKPKPPAPTERQLQMLRCQIIGKVCDI